MSVNPPPNPPPPPPSSPQPDPHPHGRPGTKRPHKEPADRAGAGGSAHGGHHEPVLKRTVVKPAGIVPDPVDAAYVANRLTALTHELANLLDGSLRVINLARKPGVDETPEHVSKHIETVYAAMLQMADLVRNSMTGLAPVGNDGMRHALGATGSLAIAVNHAVNVMKPVAEERNIELVCEAGPEINDAPAGPIYGVIINGVKNAIESIQRSGQTDGRVVVRAWMEAGRTGRCVGIEISDNGEGPPPLPPSHAGKGKGRSVFDVGVTTKEGGAGIGLALCKEVIEHLGGTIELVRRNGGGTKGAVLKVRYPAPAPMTDRHVG